VSLTKQQILAGIAEVARVHLGWVEPLDPELRLVEDLELDSIKSLTLALEVENHFRVCLDEEAGIITVGDLVRVVEEHLDV
jgi:acyl carrier protein